MKTEERLAEALKKLMATVALDDISVMRLSQMCGINRQSFYYHFRNTYDLLTWVFLNEKIPNLEGEKDYSNTLGHVFNYVENNYNLIQNTAQSAGKDLLIEFFFNTFYNVEMRHINELDTKQIMAVEDKKFIASFYGSAFANMILLWLRDPNQEESSVIIERAKKYFPNYLDQIIRKEANHD